MSFVNNIPIKWPDKIIEVWEALEGKWVYIYIPFRMVYEV